MYRLACGEGQGRGAKAQRNCPAPGPLADWSNETNHPLTRKYASISKVILSTILSTTETRG